MGIVVLGMLIFVFKDARFRVSAEQWIGGTILGLLVTAAWYLTGHVGFAENPDTLEMTYFATNSRTLESLSFVAPTAYSLELLMLWTDKSLRMTFGIATALGVVRRFADPCHQLAPVPLGRIRLVRRSAQPSRRRHPDGLRRRHVDGLHHRPGNLTGVSTLALGFVHRRSPASSAARWRR